VQGPDKTLQVLTEDVLEEILSRGKSFTLFVNEADDGQDLNSCCEDHKEREQEHHGMKIPALPQINDLMTSVFGVLVGTPGVVGALHNFCKTGSKALFQNNEENVQSLQRSFANELVPILTDASFVPIIQAALSKLHADLPDDQRATFKQVETSTVPEFMALLMTALLTRKS